MNRSESIITGVNTVLLLMVVFATVLTVLVVKGKRSKVKTKIKK